MFDEKFRSYLQTTHVPWPSTYAVSDATESVDLLNQRLRCVLIPIRCFHDDEVVGSVAADAAGVHDDDASLRSPQFSPEVPRQR